MQLYEIYTEEEVTEQLAKVREDGRANMVDMRAVQSVASLLDCYQLVVFCQDLLELRQSERAKEWMLALDRLGEHLSRVPEER